MTVFAIDTAARVDFGDAADQAKCRLVALFASPPISPDVLRRPSQTSSVETFFAFRADGSITAFDCAKTTASVVLAANDDSDVRLIVVAPTIHQSPMVIRGTIGGVIEAYETGEERTWTRSFVCRFEDTLTAAARTDVDGHLVLGFSSGRIVIVAATTGEELGTVSTLAAPVRQIGAVDASSSRCPNCAETMPPSLVVAASTSRSVHLFRVVLGASTSSAFASCVCRPNPPGLRRSDSSLGSHSNGDSAISTSSIALPSPRSALKSLSKRRTSHIGLGAAAANGIDQRRRNVSDSTDTSDTPGSDALVRSALNVVAADSRGQWACCGAYVAGIRRKAATTDEWEVWSVDAAKGAELVGLHEPPPLVVTPLFVSGDGARVDDAQGPRGDPLGAAAATVDDPARPRQLPFTRVGMVATSTGGIGVMPLANALAVLDGSGARPTYSRARPPPPLQLSRTLS